jgi:hypothetical protein
VSYTSIYAIGGSSPYCLGEVRNAWRGAMQVWNYVACRYCGMDTFPMSFDQKQGRQGEVWNAFKKPDMPPHERIVLLSTLDGATAPAEYAGEVADAFEQYAKEQGTNNCSLAEQAEIIRNAKLSDGQLIAWNQTSVAEFWGHSWDEDLDDFLWYDPLKEDRHFDILSEAKRYEPEPTQ